MKSDKPLVSIITPSYNQGKFIEETIQSVLTQDYPYIEYIVVDGGSTDNTLEILKKYRDRLKWISEPDRGQSDALNKGFAMAQGDILAWLNSDDTYLPGAISKIVNYIREHPSANLVYGRTLLIDETGKVVGVAETGPADYEKLAVLNLICQPSTFFRKEAWDEAGGVNPQLRYTMDHDLWIRMAKKTSLDYIEEFLSTYRLHGESKTMSPRHAVEFNKEILDTIMKYYNWAPLNRVYVYCYHRLKSGTHPRIAEKSTLIALLSVIYSIALYLRLNKRIKFYDLKMINRQNLSKLFKEWIDIYKGH